jgi:putative cell wall-binding protein
MEGKIMKLKAGKRLVIKAFLISLLLVMAASISVLAAGNNLTVTKVDTTGTSVTIKVSNNVNSNDNVTIKILSKSNNSIKYLDQIKLTNGVGEFKTVLAEGTYYGNVRSAGDNSSVEIPEFTVVNESSNGNGGSTGNGGTPPTTEEPKAAVTLRLGGTNRYETSVKVSQAGWTTSDNVVLARGDNFADALTAAPFAKQLKAPILLTGSNALDSGVALELKRLKAKKVYMIGGTGAISSAVENAVKALGITIERISGSDRYDTSLAIASKMTNKKQVFLATGYDFADALSISSYAAATGNPILLTAKNQMTAGASKFIKDNSSKVYVIGGSGVITDSVIKSIAGAERISGADRYATNLAIVSKFASEFDLTNIYLATGANYPDAICGSALAGKEKAPIILVKNNDTANQRTFINTVRAKLQRVKILGGAGVITESTVKTILN